MKTEKINIQDLKPAHYNPRIMPPTEMKKLKNGLQTYGLVDPIIIDLTDNNTIIGGHQRHTALMEIDPEMQLTLIRLGDIGLVIRETELHVKDKNDQKALNLALNKIQGEWDYSKLDDLLVELNDDGYQIELTGFDTDDITFELEENINLTEFSKDYHKDEDTEEYNNLIEQYTEEKGKSSKDENWFYVEFYGEEDKFKELSQKLAPYLNQGKHEIDSEYFYEVMMR